MILLGTDPEVFLKSKSTGKFVSAHGKFPGTKHEPSPLGNFGMLQVDGHALEFNTNPAANEDEFYYFVNETFNLVKKAVNDVDPDLEIALEPVAEFDASYFTNLPEESKILGCDPDFSGLDGHQLDSPAIGNSPIRTSSGHIHIGFTLGDNPFDEEMFKNRLAIANRVTPHLLVAAKAWENSSSVARRQYYGREMAFRPKHYGVELRALDCLWLKSEETIRKVYRTTIEAFTKEFPQYAR